MSISDQIKGVTDQKSVIIKQMESMMDSETALDDGEQKKFDDYEGDIKLLDDRLKNLERTEQLIAKNSAVAVTVPDQTTPIMARQAVEREDKSLFYPKMIHAMFVGKGDSSMASRYAKDVMKNDLVAKAVTMPPSVIQKATIAAGNTGTDTWAEELGTIGQYNSAFIEMLRPMSIVARFPGRQMTFDGNNSILIPRQTAGVSGGWVAEADGIVVNKLAFDQVTLTPKKNGTIVPVTNELIARSDPSALGLVRDDLLKGIATSIDTKFCSDDAVSAGVSPAGLLTYDSSVATSAGDTLDNITTDLKNSIAALNALNMPMQQPVWIMHPTRVNSLRFIRDGLGTYAFRDEINSGMLVGYPIMESTVVTVTEIMLVDASQVIIATDLVPEISISSDASLHMEDTTVLEDIGGAASVVQSMFQIDSTAVKAVTRLDWGVRYANCVQGTNACTW